MIGQSVGEGNGIKADGRWGGDDEPANGSCAPLSHAPLKSPQLAIGKHAWAFVLHSRQEFRGRSIRLCLKPGNDRRPDCFEWILSRSPVSTRLWRRLMSWTDLAVPPRRREAVKQRSEVGVQLGNVGRLPLCQQCDVMLNCANLAEQPERVEGLLNNPEPEFERHLRACDSCVAYLDSYRETIRVARDAERFDDALTNEAPDDLIEAILKGRSRL